MKIKVNITKLVSKLLKKNKQKINMFEKIGVCPKCKEDLIFDAYKEKFICPNCKVKETIKKII